MISDVLAAKSDVRHPPDDFSNPMATREGLQSTTDVLKLEFHNKLDLILGSTGNVLSECQTSAELRRI
jgi:hypothetical protein